MISFKYVIIHCNVLFVLYYAISWGKKIRNERIAHFVISHINYSQNVWLLYCSYKHHSHTVYTIPILITVLNTPPTLINPLNISWYKYITMTAWKMCLCILKLKSLTWTGCQTRLARRIVVWNFKLLKYISIIQPTNSSKLFYTFLAYSKRMAQLLTISHY